MILHERRSYPEEVRLVGPEQGRILANASTYWPAAALGQLSVALALAGCAVVTDATELLDLRRLIVEERVDVLGVVPDMLGLLSISPAQELPWVRAVLSWGERLPRATAMLWHDHPRAQIHELLISTEYWLSFHADPLALGGPVARPVSDAVQVCVLNEHGQRANEGETGELCLKGPMVTPGYLDENGNNDAFSEVDGERFFRTRDSVRVVDGGFVFHGRTDMLTKEKGQWVDMGVVEQHLQDIEGIAEACIVPDSNAPSEFHAFVALRERSDYVPIVSALRTALPWRASIHIIPELPRHVATGKTDVAALRRCLRRRAQESWPVYARGRGRRREPGEDDEEVSTRLRARLREKARRCAAWTAAALLVALVGAADLRGLALRLL